MMKFETIHMSNIALCQKTNILWIKEQIKYLKIANTSGIKWSDLMIFKHLIKINTYKSVKKHYA